MKDSLLLTKSGKTVEKQEIGTHEFILRFESYINYLIGDIM